MPRLFCPLLVIALMLVASASWSAAPGDAIDVGDRVKITVLGADDLTGEAVVNPQGNVSLPVVGLFKVAGKIPDDAATELKSALKKYVKDPQVRVEVIQKAASLVVVSGRVKKPGGYAITSRTTLLELVGVAGGADTNANLDAVSVVHLGSKTPESINLQSFIDGKSITSNPILANGDIIMVPEKDATVGVVFVLGEVKKLGSFELRQGMKIHEAIMEAGGITDAADPLGATVTTKDGVKQEFDLMKALALDTKEDRVLNPGDTIYLRTSSGTFNIYGAVNRPGSYAIKQSIPLTDALAMAGGYTGHAQIKSARILRSSRNKSIPIDLAKVEKTQAENMQVYAGDTIIVPERGERRDPLSILSAIGSLGWLIWR